MLPTSAMAFGLAVVTVGLRMECPWVDWVEDGFSLGGCLPYTVHLKQGLSPYKQDVLSRCHQYN